MDLLRLSDDPAATVDALERWLSAERPVPLVIETSGSTGLPKHVVLSRDAVLASARASARRLDGSGRWALVLPPAYVAGVQVVVRSLLAGGPPVLGGWADARGPAAYTSLVPTQLHRMLDSPDDLGALRRMSAVLVGGGPIDPDLRTRAAGAGVRMVATYGASETAGGCVYDGVPLDGVAVALDPDGRIRIGGPTLFTGYAGAPALTAETLVDGWYRTSDAGRIDEDGRLQVLGRIDDVVISGGVKVPLPAVRRRMLAHPAAAQVEVVPVPDREWGQRVAAVVVPAAGTGVLDRDDWRDWVAAEHPRSWAPAQVLHRDELPLLGNGKVDRAALIRWLAEEAPR